MSTMGRTNPSMEHAWPSIFSFLRLPRFPWNSVDATSSPTSPQLGAHRRCGLWRPRVQQGAPWGGGCRKRKVEDGKMWWWQEMARKATSGSGAFPGHLIWLRCARGWSTLAWRQTDRVTLRPEDARAMPVSALLLWWLTWRSNCLETTLVAQYKPTRRAYGTQAAQTVPQEATLWSRPHLSRSTGVRGAGIGCPSPSDPLRQGRRFKVKIQLKLLPGSKYKSPGETLGCWCETEEPQGRTDWLS